MSEATIEALRKEAAEILEKNRAGYAVRSCWNCNEAHEHLKGSDYPIYCLMGCGHWFYKGEDITEIEQGAINELDT